MVYIKQDTLRLKECGKQIDSAVTKCNEEINKFFAKVNKIGDCWIGEDADLFLTSMKQEKKIYLDFNGKINAYADSLIEMSLQIEKAINACKFK